MKKFKISISFFVLIIFCLIFKNFLLLLNYLIALTIHEMSHILVAYTKGYKLKKIKLDMFGMSVDLDSPLDDKDNFSVNIAGPISNLLVCLLCLACYSIIPSSFHFLNTFCISNLTLAIFNLIPIYPLDGGKIFYKFIDNKKYYKFLNFSIRLTIISLSLFFAYINLFNSKILFILTAIFFTITNKKPTPSLVFFKNLKTKSIQKIELIKIDSQSNLYDLIKLIKSNKYTIFYSENLQQKYFNQDDLISISLKYPLSTKIKDCRI